MPAPISVRHDYLRARDALNDLARRQLPYATAAALTDTAQAARQQVTAALPHIFDRPVPFTLNAIGFKPATKANLTAVVFVRPVQAQYLLHEEIGGTRTTADNTRRPGAAFSLPGTIPLDAYGNIPNGAIGKLGELSRAVANARQLAEAARTKRGSFGSKGLAEKALKTATRRRAALASRVAHAVGNSPIAYLKGNGLHGAGPGGFFARLPDHKITRITSFGAVAHYKPIFRYQERVALVAHQTFRVALMRRLREALATAR